MFGKFLGSLSGDFGTMIIRDGVDVDKTASQTAFINAESSSTLRHHESAHIHGDKATEPRYFLSSSMLSKEG